MQNLARAGDRISEAVTVARHSDVVILCVGLDATLEGEEMDAGKASDSGDKWDLLLPESQRRLAEAVCAVGTPVVLVLNSGSAIDLSAVEARCSAILECWYSGAQGGRALAEILFGKANPSGKLPVTFYYDGTLPDFRDYRMKGRTYRYLEGEPLYPFGYGLSYSRFRFDDLRLEIAGAGGAAAEPAAVRGRAAASDGKETVEPDGKAGEADEAAVASAYSAAHGEKSVADCGEKAAAARGEKAAAAFDGKTDEADEAAAASESRDPLLRGSIRVTNESGRDGAAVVQIYVDSQPREKVSNGRNRAYMDRFDSENQPRYSLCWFKRVQVASGQSVRVPFELSREAFETVLEDGSRALLAGRYTVYAGGSQPDARSRELLGGEDWCSGEIELETAE